MNPDENTGEGWRLGKRYTMVRFAPHPPTYTTELTRERDDARRRFKAYAEEPGDLEILARWGIRAVLDCQGNVREVLASGARGELHDARQTL